MQFYNISCNLTRTIICSVSCWNVVRFWNMVKEHIWFLPSYSPYAMFCKYSKAHNHGIFLGFIESSQCQMAGKHIALCQILWLLGATRTIGRTPNLCIGFPNIFWCKETNPSWQWGICHPSLKPWQGARITLDGRISPKDTFPRISMRYKLSTLQCQVAILMGWIGSNNSSPRSYKSHTHSGSTKISHFMTNTMATFTTRSQKSWWWRWVLGRSGCRGCPKGKQVSSQNQLHRTLKIPYQDSEILEYISQCRPCSTESQTC